MNPSAGGASAPVRLAHFSDIHISVARLGWTVRDYFTKRYAGWINFRWLGRRFRFRTAEEVLAAFVAEMRRRPPDRLVFSGDATALGFETEFARAAALLGLNGSDHLPGLAVPGNHDYYTRAVETSGLFERYFAPWQAGERVDGTQYPFAQRVGPVWLVGVNSCKGNRWTWDASGAVDAAQLERLRRLLKQLDAGPRILVTHYPIALGSGRPERRSHGLRNLKELVDVAAVGGVGLWLHGHRHGPYFLDSPAWAPFPAICAGSATQHGLWSYGDYTVAGRRFHGLRRVFDPEQAAFRDGGTFEFELRG